MVNWLIIGFELVVGAAALASYLRLRSLETIMSILVRRFMAHLFMQKMLVLLAIESFAIGQHELAVGLIIASIAIQGLAIIMLSLALFGRIHEVIGIKKTLGRLYGRLFRTKD